MNKIVIIILSVLLLTTGCSLTTKLDFDKLDKELQALKTDKISLNSVIETVETDPNFLGIMDSVFINDMKTKFLIDGDNLFSDGIIRIPNREEDKFSIYMVLKVKDGKNGEAKIALENFFSSLTLYQEEVKKMIKTEIDGYLVYILTDKNDEVLNRIKSAKELVFPSLLTLDKDQLENKFGINKDLVDEAFVKVPMMSTNESTLIIVKAKTGKSGSVKKDLDKYFKEKEASINYPAQKELFENRLTTRMGSYLVYVISIDNDKVLKTIKESKQ